MKLSSPRTWLFVVAGVLVVAGGVVLYVIKNPPLPPGWTWHEAEHYRVALPPGVSDTLLGDSAIVFIHDIGRGNRVTIYSLRQPGPDARAVDEILDMREGTNPFTVGGARRGESERVTIRGYPARVYSTIRESESGRPEGKCFVILAKDRIHEFDVPLVPGVFSEDDADFLFRSFRPR